MIKRCLTSLVATLIVCFLACSSASARVCFLPDSTDCGEGDVAGSGNVDVPCQYSSCPAYNTNYQECYDERTYNNGGVNVTCKQIKCKLSKSECEKQEADANNSQCCNFDSASGCYYMGSCKLCNRDVFDSEKNLGEGYDCYPCKDKNGTFYNCTAKEKECNQINPNYTSSCGDSQTPEKVEGVKDSKGNQCYTCKSKPIDKCVDIEATPFLDIIEPTVKTVKASGEVKEVNAKLECGINPKKAYKYEINIISNYDYIKLPVKRIKPVEYRYYVSGGFPGYYYKTNIDGKNVCITDRLCTQYAKEGEYISAYEISIHDESVKLDYKIYCCKTDDNFSGDSLSHLYSSCKEAQTVFESQHIDRYIEPFYVCDKGIKEGTKCKIGSYSCPKDYKLSGDNCVKKECPKGYFLTSDNGKDVCVNPTYTCPTDGKYKYKLSGDKCVCDNSKTCSEISNGSWKGEKDKNTCPTGYKPEVVKSTIGATAFSDGPCYKCEKIEDKTITIYLTNTETKDQSSSTLICNGQIERVNSTTKEYVEFSHDSNHTVKLRLNGPNKPCTELYADPIVLEEDNSYDLYAEFPSGDGSISGYYYDNVPTSFEVVVDGVVVASDEIRRGKIDNTNWTHLRVLSSLNGKVIQPSKSNPYTIKFVYENEKNNTCYKKSSSGTVANKSTIYYYRADEPYKNGECASEMTLNVVCDNTNLKAKLYVNGKESQKNPNSYQNTEGKWFGDFMNCTGCATVECTFKYGDKTKITIPQTGGPGD